MSQPSPMRPLHRTTLLVVVTAAVFAIVCQYALLFLFKLLGYGWDIPKGRAIPALVFYFMGGIVAIQRRRPPALRALAIIVASSLAIPAWWLTPQNHVSLRQAGRIRDELRTDVSSRPDWDKAFIAEALKDKHDELLRASRSMAQQIDMDRWADEVGVAIDERFRKLSADDLEGAVQTGKAYLALFFSFSGATSYEARDAWIEKAVTAKKNELNQLPDADWAGFDRTAIERHLLADSFLRGSRAYRLLEQLVAAEEEWGLKGVNAALAVVQNQKSPKLTREVCRDFEKQLLALKSLESSPARFLKARALLLHTAQDAAEAEIRLHFKAGSYDLAYGIARKLAVDWFATAELLGGDEQKSLVTLRESCRQLAGKADSSADSPELAPAPRTRETPPKP
jgi:hypothetical protein